MLLSIRSIYLYHHTRSHNGEFWHLIFYALGKKSAFFECYNFPFFAIKRRDLKKKRELTHLTEAIADYQAYLAASPEDEEIWRQLGQVYDMLGDSEHAQAAYQQAEQLMTSSHALVEQQSRSK